MLFAIFVVVTHKFGHAIAQAVNHQTLTMKARFRFKKWKLERYPKDHDFQRYDNVD
jgi:hypothetical protein